MCGIIAVFGISPKDGKAMRAKLLLLQKLLRHRGPDWSGTVVQSNAVLSHERLGIVNPESGHQPLISHNGDVALAANGEIYNHMKTRAKFKDYKFSTKSDCESILPLWFEHGVDCVKHLDGQFAFVLSDQSTGQYIAARDPIGIVPLYYGHGEDGTMWFASEMKAIVSECPTFHQFPPGHVYDSKTKKFIRWYEPDWYMKDGWMPPKSDLNLKLIRETLITAVEKRLMTDVPWGVLLSGGLDSSLVASIASRLSHRRMTKENAGYFPRMHSFCVGLEGSPDLAAARKVADFLKTVHHEFNFTVQEGLDAVSDVIYHLETYDVTTVRASTPMYLMSRKIKACGVKMVLSGEGADEIMAGYLYFHKCPNRSEMQKETVSKLKDLMYFDCLRANKSTMAWGLEARVPFLDKDFLDMAMTMDPDHKLSGTHPGGKKMEKWALRKAFDDKDEPWLPESVLWRQKEQFSDGVGYNWIDSLKATANAAISDAQLDAAAHRFPHQPPKTKEAYYIRKIFETHYPQESSRKTVPQDASIACSTARAIEWDAAFKEMAKNTMGDCSGRAVAGVHNSAWEKAPTTGRGEGQESPAKANGNGSAPPAKRARTQ